MKLAKHNNALKTNTKTESKKFGIGDPAVVIEILRNRLYKHKIRTLVQEYISNGRDATREVGSKRNIKVIAPTDFEPIFKVRDYGPGISPDRIENVFINYGSSTKRSSNNQTGGFGIGAKSAWSYTDSFNVITYIDGVKRTYLAHTGSSNEGQLDFLGETTTNEPNGTEIQVAVAPNNKGDFYTAILRAVHFWDEDVDLHGMDVAKSELERGFRLGNLEIVKSNDVQPYGIDTSWYGAVALAIDGILYQIDRSVFRDVLDTSIINGIPIIHVDVGVVAVNANREEIDNSPENTKVLHRIFREVNNSIYAHIDKEMKSAKTLDDKIKKVAEINKHFKKSYDDGTYKISHDGTLASKLFEEVNLIKYSMRRGKLRKVYVQDKNKTRSYSSKAYTIGLNNLYYFDNSESLVKRGHRVREFLLDNREIIVLELKDSTKSIYNKLIKDLPFDDLKTLTYTEVPKTASPRVKRANTEFCIHEIGDDYGVDKYHTTLASNKRKLYYVEMNGNAFPRSKSQLREIVKFLGIRVCGLSKSNIQKVKGDKNFKCLNTYLKKLKPDDKQIKQMIFNESKNRKLFRKFINSELIESEKLKEMSKIYETFKGMGDKYTPVMLAHWEKHEKVLKFKQDDAEVTNVVKPCKLLDSLRSDYTYVKICKDEVTFYINCKLKEAQNEQG